MIRMNYLFLMCYLATISGRLCPPCQNGITIPGYNCPTCICNPGFTGSDCSERVCPICENGVTISTGEGNCPTCICNPDFTGSDCSERVCPICENGVTISTGEGNCPMCICNPGFTGNDCSERICLPDLCDNGGSVMPSGGDCSCDCISNFCQNGATTLDDCSCNCPPGFTGSDCSILDCSSFPCPENQIAEEDSGFCVCRCPNELPLCADGFSFNFLTCSCVCPPGSDCSNLDCSSFPCPENQIAEEESGECVCRCPPETPRCISGILDTLTCSCVCDPNFTGDDCNEIIDPCIWVTCGANAISNPNGDQCECLCPRGFAGNPYSICTPIKKRYNFRKPEKLRTPHKYGFRRPRKFYNRNYGNQHSRFYPRTEKPRCKRDKTWVEIHVSGTNRKACSFALIELVADKTCKTIETNKYGFAKALIHGCELSMMVTAEGMQPNHQTLSLLGNKMKIIRLNVKLKLRCNYLVYFYNEGDESDGELIEYMVRATDGRSKIDLDRGKAVGSQSPVCVHWPTSENFGRGRFKMIGTTQSGGNFFLDITTRHESAAVVISPYTTSNLIEGFEFLFCFNLWIKNEAQNGLFNDFSLIPLAIDCDSKGQQGNTKDFSCYRVGYGGTGRYCRFFFYIEVGASAHGNVIEGSVSIQDRYGKVVSSEIPRTQVTADKPVWGIYCDCHLTDKARDLVLLNVEDYSPMESIYEFCNEPCFA